MTKVKLMLSKVNDLFHYNNRADSLLWLCYVTYDGMHGSKEREVLGFIATDGDDTISVGMSIPKRSELFPILTEPTCVGEVELDMSKLTDKIRGLLAKARLYVINHNENLI